jgi:predicted flap endonuclease-1-like 5' DNA nuclease
VRSVYIIIGFFFVWCLLCAQWYLFWVKGLSPQPENINPHESAWAIAEILMMILISVLIGFALAWFLRQQIILKQKEEVQNLLTERSAHLASQHIMQEQIQKSETILARARETFREDFLTVSRDNERLKAELDEFSRIKETLDTEVTKLQSENEAIQSKLDQSKKEFSQLQLAKQKFESDQELLAQKSVTQNSINERQSSKPDKEDKDDLKVIKGIGPGIEKKLNQQGIYSYRQISDFTPDFIKKLTEAILFFPGRIERDRWVEQASKLYLDKIRN